MTRYTSMHSHPERIALKKNLRTFSAEEHTIWPTVVSPRTTETTFGERSQKSGDFGEVD